ncbi:MAG TPA: carbohydrate porin [Stellaceae bacterium]|nr:carbohydrate porin [Stellaceae bacterium]
MLRRFLRYAGGSPPAWFLTVLVACLSVDPAAAQNAPSTGATPQSDTLEAGTGFLSGLSRRSNLLGDIGGLRSFLSRRGVEFTLTETSEVLGNVSGGVKQGFAYDGLTQMGLQVDTDKAFGWEGGTFNVSALQIHGRNLSADNLQSLQTASGIEADRATRLWELWYQQQFLDGQADVKLGQQSLDQEFMVSSNALLFVNTMFGWAMLPSADLPGGGPAYPLSSLGVRLRGKPTEALTLLGGVFNGSPASTNTGDSQKRNPSGTSFPTNGGVLAFAELQYEFPANGSMVQSGQRKQLPGVYKLGAWYDSERFADQRYDTSGLSLADPNSTGNARQHRGNFSLYGVVDQTLWQAEGESTQSLSFFSRVMGAPADRNLISFSLNAGLTLKAPLPGRDNDTVGLGMGFAQVSGRASGLDRDSNVFNGTSNPVRGSETYIEATYQYQVFPWWQVQPDLQYVFNPGAGIANPNNAGQRVKDEAVLGLRTVITF